MRKRILGIYGAVLGIGIAYAVVIAVTGWSLPCVFYETTGFLCPGCGMTRMCLSLLRGDLVGAFAYHPVAMILLCVWNLIAVLCLTPTATFVKDKRFLYTMLGITAAAFVVWGVVRNIIG